MGDPQNSPFNRSVMTSRSPPPTPIPEPEANEDVEEMEVNPPNTCNPDPTPTIPALNVIRTRDLQNWMSNISKGLEDISTVATDSKMNTEQKLRVSNMCTKIEGAVSQFIMSYQSVKQTAAIYYNTIEHMQEKLDLLHTLKEIKKTVQETKQSPEQISFADMVKKGANSFVRPTQTNSVIIVPNDKKQTSEQTKALVQKIISPEDMKLHVRGVRKLKNGGVVISTQGKEDIQKLKQSEKLTESGLTVEERTKRRPRIIIIGVPSSLTEKQVFDGIFEQNLADKYANKTKDQFLSSIKLSHKSGKKDSSSCNYIIEVPAGIRSYLIAQDRVFIEWTSCPVRDFTLVTRCFKCQQYGHAAKTCRDLNPTCSHCGIQDHNVNDCPKKSEPPQCATCKRYKKPGNHKTGDAECPARKFAEERYINSVDYEGA